MTSYLIYSKDEAQRRDEAITGADFTLSVSSVPDEEGSSECTPFRNHEAERIMLHERETEMDTSHSHNEVPESIPLLTASCSFPVEAGPVAHSSAPASIEDEMTSEPDLEAPSFVDEYHHHRCTNMSRRKFWRHSSRGKTLGSSEDSGKDSTESTFENIPRLMEVYCTLLTAVLLFALGLLAGRHIWEYPISINSPSGISDSTGIGSMGQSPEIPKITVGTYYYPWHGGDFHRGDGYVRKLLGQAPALGEYDDRDPSTISQHLEWSKQGNIALWVTSWWGPYEREDNTTRTVILEHEELKKGGPFETHKVALFYETFGRIRKQDYYSLHRLKPDMEFICEHYFDHPNYYTLDNGRPVLFMYLTRYLETLVSFDTVITIMRKSIKDACGKDVFIIGDQIFGPYNPVQGASAFDSLDGVTNYDVYGSMATTVGAFGGYIEEYSVTDYYLSDQRKWRKYAKEQKGCSFIPAVSPGYNDRAVRPEAGHIPLARSLERKSGGGNDEGSLFRVSIEHARTLVDPSASYLLLVNSFNEWHEDTQIEPVVGESASTPYNLAFGIEYHGYGTSYLDILRNATSNVHIVV